MNMVSLGEYYKLLVAHDWYYERSSDRNHYAKGAIEKDHLQIVAKQSEEHAQLYHAYAAFAFGRGFKPNDPDAVPVDIIDRIECFFKDDEAESFTISKDDAEEILKLNESFIRCAAGLQKEQLG